MNATMICKFCFSLDNIEDFYEFEQKATDSILQGLSLVHRIIL